MDAALESRLNLSIESCFVENRLKNKCEVLPEEEDWGFEATAQLVVGFQGLQFRNEEDNEHTWVGYESF